MCYGRWSQVLNNGLIEESYEPENTLLKFSDDCMVKAIDIESLAYKYVSKPKTSSNGEWLTITELLKKPDVGRPTKHQLNITTCVLCRLGIKCKKKSCPVNVWCSAFLKYKSDFEQCTLFV